MGEAIQIDQAGRVQLPKAARERLHLAEGDTLLAEVKGDAIELRPTKAAVALKEVNGVLVIASPSSSSADRDLSAEERELRIQELIKRVGE